MGVQNMKKPSARGDHYFTVVVQIPTHIRFVSMLILINLVILVNFIVQQNIIVILIENHPNYSTICKFINHLKFEGFFEFLLGNTLTSHIKLLLIKECNGACHRESTLILLKTKFCGFPLRILFHYLDTYAHKTQRSQMLAFLQTTAQTQFFCLVILRS